MNYLPIILGKWSDGEKLEAVKLKADCREAGELSEEDKKCLRQIPDIHKCVLDSMESPPSNTIGNWAEILYCDLSLRYSDRQIEKDSGLSAFHLVLAKGARLKQMGPYQNIVSYFLTIKGIQQAFGPKNN